MITDYIVEGQDHGRPIVAALEVDETGTVINAAPILKRAVGRPISWMIQRCVLIGWTIEWARSYDEERVKSNVHFLPTFTRADDDEIPF